MRAIITTAALALSLAFAGSASAAPFAGPWDSAHQPTTITNPGIHAGAPDVTRFSFGFDPSVLCINNAYPETRIPVTITVEDQSGTMTQDISSILCPGAVTNVATGSPDFSINDTGSDVVYVQLPPQPRVGAICADGWHSTATGSGACSDHGGVRSWLVAPGSPWFYTISGPTGILAQDALTGIFTQGWPAPPAPPAPTPPSTPPTPTPPTPPKSHAQSKPALRTLTRSVAVGDLKTALRRQFKAAFQTRGYQANCRRSTRTSFTCHPRWGHGGYSYSGTARVWLSMDSHTRVSWNYLFRVTRTSQSCVRLHRAHCTKTYVGGGI